MHHQITYSDILYDVFEGKCFPDGVWRVYPNRPDLYAYPTGNTRKAVIKKVKEMLKIPCVGEAVPAANFISLGSLSGQTPAPVKKYPCGLTECNICEQKEKKERDMYTNLNVSPRLEINAPASETSEQRGYLRSRLSDIFWSKNSDLRKTYGLEDMDAPKNLKELKQRLADGMYSFRKNNDGDDYEDDYEFGWNGPLHMIRWRDPAVKEDREGFDAAMKRMEEAKTKVADAIAIFEASEALAAVQEFEKQSFAAQ